MCRRKNKAPTPLPVAPPIQPRIITDDSKLPEEKKLITKDDTAEVEFGSSERASSGVGTRSQGTGALRIQLNTGGTSAASSRQQGGLAGGMNV